MCTPLMDNSVVQDDDDYQTVGRALVAFKYGLTGCPFRRRYPFVCPSGKRPHNRSMCNATSTRYRA